MTQQKTFKKQVRARMAQTGESYAAARAQILRPPAPSLPGLLPGWSQAAPLPEDVDLDTLHQVLLWHSASDDGDGAPLSRAMLYGLGGGLGFMCFVFEYRGLAPMLTVGCRRHTTPLPFISAMLERAGLQATVHTTSGAATAARHLDTVLAAGRPALVQVDAAWMPSGGQPRPSYAIHPRQAAVVGRDGDDFWVVERAPRPQRVPVAVLAAARGASKKARHHLIDLQAGAPRAGHDLATALRAAIAETVEGLTTSPHKGYERHFGLAGLTEWRRLLTDGGDKKGWAHLLGAGEAHALARLRLHACLTHDYTPPAAGRPLYAAFLTETAALLGTPGLTEAADLFRQSAGHWSAIAARAIWCAEPGFARVLAIDAARQGVAGAEAEALWAERQALLAQSPLTLADDPDLFAEIAAHVEAILALEGAAVARLRGS